MTAVPYHYGASERRDPGFFRRMWAKVIKEFVQMRRDRMTFAMMIMVPIMQLVLFGYAINTDPKQLPAAVLARDDGPLTRAVLAAMTNTDRFDFKVQVHDPEELDRASDLASSITHRHPLAMEGARLIARATAMALGDGFELASLHERCRETREQPHPAGKDLAIVAPGLGGCGDAELGERVVRHAIPPVRVRTPAPEWRRDKARPRPCPQAGRAPWRCAGESRRTRRGSSSAPGPAWPSGPDARSRPRP